jgi:hypothetical protein
MKLEIHFVGRRWMMLPVRELPTVPERVEVLPAAFRAWTVAGCEGNRFVQKEQFRVPVGHHDDAVPSFEFENACDTVIQR